MNFRDLPIRRKLALLILTSSVLAVILACLGFAIYERQNFRANTANELPTLADTLGANTAASLAFNDPKTAREMLAALRAEHHVLGACLYDNHGQYFCRVSPGRPGRRIHDAVAARRWSLLRATLHHPVPQRFAGEGQDRLHRDRVGPEWNSAPDSGNTPRSPFWFFSFPRLPRT